MLALPYAYDGERRYVVGTPQEVADQVLAIVHERGSAHLHLVNAFTVSLASTDERYAALFQDADAWNLPDGKPLAKLLAVTNSVPVPQVRGFELLLATLKQGGGKETRHFFLGGTEHTLQAMVEKIARSHPNVVVAGTHSPGFGHRSDAEVKRQDSLLRAAQPDIVWVGLGTPKQDFEARRIARELNVVTISVGAAFDFLAGNVPEAPQLAQRLWLEWAWRFASEPRRLWRRYTVGNFKFLLWASRTLLGRTGGGRPARPS